MLLSKCCLHIICCGQQMAGTKVTNLGTVKECPQVCAAGLKVCEGMELLSSKLPELQGFAGHGNEG